MPAPVCLPACLQLARLGGAVKSRLSITFINQQGLQEAGIDMGGLMKEFLESVAAAGFDPNRGLFSATPDGFAFPSPLAGGRSGGGRQARAGHGRTGGQLVLAALAFA